jgi:hypothetical protein
MFTGIAMEMGLNIFQIDLNSNLEVILVVVVDILVINSSC